MLADQIAHTPRNPELREAIVMHLVGMEDYTCDELIAVTRGAIQGSNASLTRRLLTLACDIDEDYIEYWDAIEFASFWGKSTIETLMVLNQDVAPVHVMFGVSTGGPPHARVFHRLMHGAARVGDVEAIRTLLAYGSHVDACHEERQVTPLMVAAEAGQLEAVRCLLEMSADPMNVDDEGSTPADYAMRCPDPISADIIAVLTGAMDAAADEI